MKTLSAAAALVALTLIHSCSVQAGDMTKTDLKPFNVTIRVFDPSKGLASGQDYVLPVDSPDAEHAIASTMANAASFTEKTANGKALPVAFTCIKVKPH